MESATKMFVVKIVVIALLSAPLQGVTVKPALCPTNKIAPHRRIASYDRNRARTFGGAFIDLLSNDRPLNNPSLNDLQEQPQEDDPDDCGEIEDYDETDLSSITPQANRQPNQRRQERQDNRHIFGWFNHPHRPHWPPTPSPTTTTRRQTQTTAQTRPSPNTVSPFWSGGLFQDNAYRPPLPQYPSHIDNPTIATNAAPHEELTDYVKPVHEHGVSEMQTTYWPGIVGGPLLDIVGASPARPGIPSTRYTTPETFTRPTRYPHSTKHPRPRIPYSNSDGLVHSFFDLLF